MSRPKTNPINEDLYDRLAKHFSDPDWWLVFEVGLYNSAQQGGDAKYRRADAFAISKWSSRGFETNGIEVKATRSDWLAEIREPAKADAAIRVCRRWWVLAPVDLVGWADLTYVSCVFTWHRNVALHLARVLGAPDTRIGGQGVSYERLPPEIEVCLPDYSLYPTENYAVGFCNRGCFRKCGFCSVPLLEGKIRPERFLHPSLWVPADRKDVMLLDNEFVAYPPGIQREILRWFTQAGTRPCITQGIDLRIVARNRAVAETLAADKPYFMDFEHHGVYCAWDNPEDEADIRRGIENLLAVGFTPREIRCYELVGFGSTRRQDYHRFEVLWKEYGIRPFVMKFNNRRDDRWINEFARFVNRPAYRNVDWWTFERPGFRAADYPVETK